MVLASGQLAAHGGDDAVLRDPNGMVTQLDALGVLCQAQGWQVDVQVPKAVEEAISCCLDPGSSGFAVLGDEDGSEEADAISRRAFVDTEEPEGLAKEPMDGPVFSQTLVRAVFHETTARATYCSRLGAHSTEVRACRLA